MELPAWAVNVALYGRAGRGYHASSKSTPDRRREYRREWYAALRAATLEAYGSKCACCGEATTEFLAVDHVNGGGSAHRAHLGGRNIYLYLRNAGFPKDQFRLLCHNCNMARGLYGKCPHETAQ